MGSIRHQPPPLVIELLRLPHHEWRLLVFLPINLNVRRRPPFHKLVELDANSEALFEEERVDLLQFLRAELAPEWWREGLEVQF